MSKFIDLTEKRFDRLLVIKRMGSNKHGKSMWLCLCDCGKEKIIRNDHIKNNIIKSCGCLKIKHGHTKITVSKTYIAWQNILTRCTSPNHKSYINCGGRGITVCKRWTKFVNFLEDMGEAPKGCQIDRIDNSKGYCKSNCQWTTAKINNRNKRNNHLITHGGKTQCITVWAEEYNICPCVLRGRIRLGWPIKKALITPVIKRRSL